MIETKQTRWIYLLLLLIGITPVNSIAATEITPKTSTFKLEQLQTLQNETQESREQWAKYQAHLADEYSRVKELVEKENDPLLNAYTLSRFIKTYGATNNPFSEEDELIIQYTSKAFEAYKAQAAKIAEDNSIVIEYDIDITGYCPKEHRLPNSEEINNCGVKPLSIRELCPDYTRTRDKTSNEVRVTSRVILDRNSKYIAVRYRASYDVARDAIAYSVTETDNRLKPRGWFCDADNSLRRSANFGGRSSVNNQLGRIE
jgi:hypothetical protein